MEERYRRRKPTQAEMMLGSLDGKVPPQDVDTEKVVLGAILLSKDAMQEIVNIITPETFYLPQHSKIYSSMVSLFTASQPIDMVTVVKELKKNGDLEYAGGVHYISQLTNRVGSSANIEVHSRILLEMQLKRDIISLSMMLQSKGYDEVTDVFDLYDFAQTELLALGNKIITGKDAEVLDALLEQNIRQIELAALHKGITGVQTHLKSVDDITGGWQPSDLIIIAARPSMGKTAFVLSIATNAALISKEPVAVFSLEMSSTQLSMRALSGETGIENTELRRANGNRDEIFIKINKALSRLSGCQLYIDDTAGLTINQLRAKAKKLKAKYGIKMIIIDYLQLMRSGEKTGSREQEVSTISRNLKILAKELEIPIIALSQLSRKVEERNDKRPMLSDLRESGAIEQDADLVGFIYRPDYYGDKMEDGSEYPAGYTEIIFDKNRNGALGVAKIKFNESTTKFTDLIQTSYDNNSITDYSQSLTANKSFDNPFPTKEAEF